MITPIECLLPSAEGRRCRRRMRGLSLNPTPMTEPTNQVRMPLFDRLVDRDRFLRRDLVQVRTIDRRGVRESVRRELEQLFNTRCPIPAHLLPSRTRTVIDYGIPDFSTLSARNPSDRTRLAEILRLAIGVYEPRLANVRVEIDAPSGMGSQNGSNDFELTGLIAADLVVDDVHEPVLFSTALQMKDGIVEVR
jgi:type VI secretion system lysozyme-like protein